MLEKLVPIENIKIFHYLYAIEVALRELIIESLEGIGGPKWYRSRLPEPALKSYKDGIAFERKTKWTQLVPHHPIYYVDFPDLRIIIERKDNWRDVFKDIFSRKEFLVSELSELEFIRNKVAHNRKASIADVKIVEGAYTKLSEFVGRERFEELASRCTCALGIHESMVELGVEAEKLYGLCKSFSPIGELSVWKSVRSEWWFDETYLPCGLDGIEAFFMKVEEYCELPRPRGCGHKIEMWFKESDVAELYCNARIQFDELLRDWRI